MQSLHAILSGLSTSERVLVFHALASSSPYTKGKDNRLLALAEYLAKCPAPPSNAGCHKAVYGNDKPDKKIINLKKRLHERVMDTLTTEQSIYRNETLPVSEKLNIRIKKILIQFQLLHYSGKERRVAKELLLKAEKLSREYELFPSLIECLRFRKWLEGFRKGDKVYERLNQEIKKIEFSNDVLQKAVDAFYRLSLKNDFSTKKETDKFLEWESVAINKLKKEAASIKSPIINYYIKYLEIDYYQEKKKYKEVIKCCEEQLNIIQNNKSVYREIRVGIAYGNLSSCHLQLHNFKDAKQYAIKAKEFFPENSANFFIACEYEFYADFYNARYKDALQTSTQLISANPKETGEFRYSKYTFFHASAHFMLGNHKESLKAMLQNIFLKEDKEGWDIAYRILFILCQIELQMPDGASASIEALRKRLDKNTPPRFKIVHKILVFLDKEGFNFKNVSPKAHELNALLKSGKPAYKWEMLSPALVKFHEWFDSKFTK